MGDKRRTNRSRRFGRVLRRQVTTVMKVSKGMTMESRTGKLKFGTVRSDTQGG